LLRTPEEKMAKRKGRHKGKKKRKSCLQINVKRNKPSQNKQKKKEKKYGKKSPPATKIVVYAGNPQGKRKTEENSWGTIIS